MKKIIPLILIFLLMTVGLYIIFPITKEVPGPTKIVVKEDTTRIEVIKNLFELRNQLDSLIVKDSILYEQWAQQKKDVDSLIDVSFDYKGTKVSLLLVTKKYEKVKIEKKKLTQKIDSIHIEYVKLHGENYELYEQLNGQKVLNSGLTAENRKLKKTVEKASSTILTGSKVVGIGYTSSLLGKPKEYETNKMSKIRKFKFSCVLPQNELAKKEYKNITFIMYSVDNSVYIKKDTSLVYTGEEQFIECLLISPKTIEKGNHKIVVLLDGEQKHVSNFVVID